MGSKAQSTKGRSFQKPKGTRDFYPLELLRRRYVTETWRAVSIRHGFEEIDGPTFEHAELYTVKSGEGILSELFSFSREGGDDLYALRPEFTPTLARMYAAQAASLPKPCRWFCIPNFFRAERPQRGRLREFCQWNCDIIGEGFGTALDGELEIVAVGALSTLGMTPTNCQVSNFHRNIWTRIFGHAGIPEQQFASWFDWVDRYFRLTPEQRMEYALRFGASQKQVTDMTGVVQVMNGEAQAQAGSIDEHVIREVTAPSAAALAAVSDHFRDTGFDGWFKWDATLVRGLAYYTGTVFEVLAEGERAIAGGGRYDNLIELFGGPATPACGFGMGDVVLGNLLTDHGLMPGADGDAGALMDAVQNVTTGALGSVSLRPDVFVVSADEDADGDVVPLVAQLRRGVESDTWRERGGKPWDADRYAIPPMHARPTDKATRNLKKLLQDAERARARFCAIVHTEGRVQLKDLDKREDLAHPSKGDWSASPVDEHYVGRRWSAIRNG
ncbi:MAG: ATP phosphoribosyltransferase regulatory subunit [Phycisphaerales bacterium]|nr:ATP phosphoribosyltransferase regulatory subunit [Phycisphaerales bacterium]